MKKSPVKTAQSYHHGDLREAILRTGLDMLERSDAALLSIREIARANGVTAPAIYRHFPDKHALLAALAGKGLETLAAGQRAALRVGGAEGFAASGQAYVRFALKNPALFRLIFSATPLAADAIPENAAHGPARLLIDQVTALAGPGVSAQARRTSALRAWALVHGLAMLLIDRQIDAVDAEAIIRAVISANSIRIEK